MRSMPRVVATSGRGDLPDGFGPVIRGTVPQHDQRALRNLGPQALQHIDRVVAIGARVGPQPHLALVVEGQPVERDPRGQARRAGGDPEALPALAPAGAEVRVLVDVRLVQIDHKRPIALGALQHALELFDKGLPPLRVGPTQKLLGFLPRQLEAMESRTDRLATAHQPEPLPDPADQAPQRPARRGIGAGEGRRRGRTLGGSDYLAEFGFALRAKKGRRPPVRRNASASGPWALSACTQSITVWARRPVRTATWVAQLGWVMSNRASARSRGRA